MQVLEQWHAGLTVRDLDRSVRFYTEVLGLHQRLRQTQANPYTDTMLGYDDCHLEIAQVATGGDDGVSGHVIELIQFVRPEAIDEPGPMHRLGTAHVALAVDEIDDALHDRVVASGGAPVSPPVEITQGVNAGGRVMWLRDPDGVLVELVQPPRR